MPYFLTFVKRYDLLRFAGAIRLFSQMFTRVQSYADGLDSMPQVPGDVKGFWPIFSEFPGVLMSGNLNGNLITHHFNKLCFFRRIHW